MLKYCEYADISLFCSGSSLSLLQKSNMTVSKLIEYVARIFKISNKPNGQKN